MFQLFNRKQANVLGIDIGTSSVRLLELSRDGGGYHIESYGIEYLPDGVVEAKEILDANLVGECIQRLIKKTKPSSKYAAVAIPASAAISKIIQFPASMSEDEIETQLEFEAEKYIPYSIDEVSMDFHILGANADNQELMDVLLLAARSEIVDVRIEALELGGLKAKVVDSEVYAIERCYNLLDAEHDTKAATAEKLVAVCDIRSTVTTLDILCDGHVIYSREQNFGGKALIDEIQRVYEMSLQDAHLARKQGNLPEDYEEEILTPFRESCAQQISRSLQLFYSSSEHQAVDELILSGGSASTEQLATLLVEHEGIPVHIADPLSHLKIPSHAKFVLKPEDSPSLMICCGLAMRSFHS